MLLKNTFTRAQQEMFDILLSSMGVRSHNDALQVQTTNPIGGSYTDMAGRPFAINLELPTRDISELEKICDVFGFIPEQEIVITAFSNQPDDHRILGLLCLTLADRFDGLIDFCGALFPRLPLQVYRNTFWLSSWDDVASSSRDLIASLPGVAVEIPYETASNRTWAYHIADTVFLRAWLSHPDFHMIK